MATIPNSTNVRRLIPSGVQSPAGTPDRSAQFQAEQQLAGAIGGIGEDLQEQQESERNYKAEVAKAKFLKRRRELAAELENAPDDDIESAREAYEKSLEEAKSEAYGELEGGKRRELYGLELDSLASEARLNAQAKVRDRIKSREQQRIDNIAASATEEAMRGNFGVAREMMEGITRAGLQNGYFDNEEQRDAYVRKWSGATAERAIKALPAEDRLAALDEPWAKKHIPADVRQGLLDAAEQDADDQFAVDFGDEVRGLSYSEQIAAANRIKDASKREAAESRIETMRLQKERQSVELYDSWDAKLQQDPSLKIRDIPEEDFLAMKPSQRAGLKALIVARQTGIKMPFNDNAEDALLRTQRDNPGALRDVYTMFAPYMSDSQKKTWLERTVNNDPPVKSETYLQDSLLGMKADKRGKVRIAYNQFINDYASRNNGAAPPPEMTEKIVDSLILDSLFAKDRDVRYETIATQFGAEPMDITSGEEHEAVTKQFLQLQGADTEAFNAIMLMIGTPDGRMRINGVEFTPGKMQSLMRAWREQKDAEEREAKEQEEAAAARGAGVSGG